MVHHLESKPVARSELDPEASSEDHESIDHALEAQLREYFQPQYVNVITQSQDSQTNRVEDASSNLVEQDPNDEDEGYSFRLFARPVVPGLPEGEEQGPRKISLRSPSPTRGEPGFVKAERPATYYFTGETSEERADQYCQAAVSGEQLLQGRKTRWPGLEMPWRVTIVESAKSITTTSSLDTSQTGTGKRRRIGKKRRIAIRTQKAAEREKRTRKNREKKVKKRQKDKLKESGVGQALVKIP